MSFCSELKNELSQARRNRCCQQAFCYGFLLFSRSFSLTSICMQTENRKAAETYAALLREVYGAEVTVTAGGGKRPTYCAKVVSEADRMKILASVDFGIFDGSINRECFVRDCCEGCFVRGAFLACGHLSDPEKAFRVDFPVRSKELALALQSVLADHLVETHLSARGNGFVVYAKRSEMIGNLLTLMGASQRSLELLETTVLKSLKNRMNRARNCDSANIGRTVESSIRVRHAVEVLTEHGLLESLPGELQTAARLRCEHPSASLKELCRLCPEPITVSGLNHRFARLLEHCRKWEEGQTNG